MSKIRKLYFFDKKKVQEMISFLNQDCNDRYINHFMFNLLLPLHHLLPLKLKFLPESFVLKDNNKVKGLITIAPTKCKYKKMEIQKLFYEESSLSVAEELIQFVVSKYKAMGAFSIQVKVDDYLPELLTLFISKCGFSQISYEKLWQVNKLDNTDFDKTIFRTFRNSDSKAVTNLYNDSLLPHFRPLLGREVREFSEKIFKGLSYYTEYKYIIEDSKNKTIVGYFSIQTRDNSNFILDIIQTSWVSLDINNIINYASFEIKKRKKNFELFVKTKRYINKGEDYETLFKQKGFECVQNQIVLTNSSARVLKETSCSGKYTILTDFFPSKPTVTHPATQCNKL